MKRIFLAILACCYISMVQAQAPALTLTLEECYALARQNYPLIRQAALISETTEYALSNAGKAYLPQLNIAGQATYQSDVTQIPVRLPGLNVPVLSKDQYKIYAEVNQVLYDGGTVHMQKKVQEANGVIEQQKLETELYKLKDRINQLYFGILLLNEQLLTLNLLKSDLEEGLRKTRAAISNGVALKSNADLLQVELLKASQHEIELKANRKAWCNMLGMFINKPVDESTVLQKPVPVGSTQTLARPELMLIEKQETLLAIQSKSLLTRNLPKLGLFVQGGYGKPALNLLNNAFDYYYIGGIRLNWALGGLYTLHNEKAIIAINQSLLQTQREAFVFNTNFTARMQNEETTRLRELIRTDKDILELRTKIKTTASAQLQNGVINTADYLRELNAEGTARENILMHEVQLLMALYNLQTTLGN